MHNFAAIFLAIELIILRPKLIPGLQSLDYFWELYMLYCLLFAHFGGVIAYSFIHPKPKIAPFMVIGLASLIAIFYTGLWFISILDQVLTVFLLSAWVMLIVQFKPNK